MCKYIFIYTQIYTQMLTAPPPTPSQKLPFGLTHAYVMGRRVGRNPSMNVGINTISCTSRRIKMVMCTSIRSDISIYTRTHIRINTSPNMHSRHSYFILKVVAPMRISSIKTFFVIWFNTSVCMGISIT